MDTLWAVSTDSPSCSEALSLNPLHQQWQTFHRVYLVKGRALWNPWTSSRTTADSLTLWMKSVSVLLQTAGLKFPAVSRIVRSYLAIVRLLLPRNRANRVNPPWNALSRTCQHVRVHSMLRSIVIQPIERWQLNVSQTIMELLAAMLEKPTLHTHTCWVYSSAVAAKSSGGAEADAYLE